MKKTLIIILSFIVFSSFYAKAQLPEYFPTVVELTCKIRDSIPKSSTIPLTEEAKIRVNYYSNYCSDEHYVDVIIDRLTSDSFPMDSTVMVKIIQQFVYNKMNEYLADSTIRFVKIFQPIYWKTNITYQIWETCYPDYRSILLFIPSVLDASTGLFVRDHFELIEEQNKSRFGASNCIKINSTIINMIR